MMSRPPGYLKAISDGSADASLLCRSNGLICHANQAAGKFFNNYYATGVAIDTYLTFSATKNGVGDVLLSWVEVTNPLTFENDRKQTDGIGKNASGNRFPVTIDIVKVEICRSTSVGEYTSSEKQGPSKQPECFFFLRIRDITPAPMQVASLEGNITKQSGTQDAILRASGQVVVVVDSSGMIRRVSDGLAEMFGYEQGSQLRNRHLSTLFQGKADRFIAKNSSDQIVQVENQQDVKMNLQVGSSIILPNNHLSEIHTAITIKKIIEKKTINPQWQEQYKPQSESSDRKFERKDDDITLGILDASFDSLFVMTEQCIIQMVNATSCKMFGFTEDEFIGKNIRMIMTSQVASKHDEYVSRYLKTGIKKMMGTQREVVAQRKDGSTFSCVLGLSQCKKSGMICGFIRDLSVDKASKAVLIKKEAELIDKEVQLINKETETKEIMNDLIKNQNVVNGILDASFHSLFVIDENCIIQMVNKKSCDDFGWTKEEFVGKNINMIMTHDVAVNHDKYVRNYLSTRIKKMIGTQRQVTARRKDGSTFPCTLGLSETQNCGLYCGFIRDLTQEKKSESEMIKKNQELANNQSLVLGILDASFHALFVINEAGIIQMVNNKSCDAFGWTKEEFVGENINMIMPAHIAINHDGYLKNYFKTGIKKMIGTQREVMACRKDGSTFPCMLDLSEAKGSGMICGFIRDMTLQKEVETAMIEKNKALQDTHSVMSGILDAAFHALFVINEQCIIQMVNAKSCEVFGWSKDEFIGKNINMIMPSNVAVHHDQYMKRYLETGLKKMLGTQREVTAQRKDGSSFPCVLGLSETQQPGLVCGYIRDLTEEKAHQAEILEKQLAAEKLSKELQANQNIIMGILDAAFHALFVINEKCIIQMVNKKSCEVFGWEKEDFIGKNINMIMPDHVAVNHDQYMKHYLETGMKKMIGTQREVTARRRDGSTFPCVLGLSETQQSGMICGFIRDLTTEKAAQAALIAKNKELEINQSLVMSILDASFHALFVIDEQCIIKMVNVKSCEVFGWTKEEFIGQNIKMIMPPDTAKHHDGYMKNYLETGMKKMIGTQREVTAQRKDGSTFPCKLGLSETKESGLICGFIRDLTTEKAAEAEILAKQRLTDKIIDASFDAMFVINERGIIEMVNDASEKVFGWSHDEFIGQNIKMIMPECRAVNHDRYLKKYMETGVKKMIGTEREVEARRKDGSTFPCILGMTEVDNGESRQFVGFVRDITDQKKKLDVAESERDAADALLYNVLPEHIANRLKQDPTHIADLYGNTTILFADIVGFTDRTSLMSPQELVLMLNDIFSRFDYLVDVYGLNKVKTIGDCYMVTSIPSHELEHDGCARVCRFALDMMRAVEAFNKSGPRHGRISFRVGISTGQVVAGVVGTKRFLFDMWGDAVNVAARMEQSGLAGQIQVTKEVVESAGDDFTFDLRGTLSIKGKGPMEVYILKSANELLRRSEIERRHSTLSVLPPRRALSLFDKFDDMLPFC
ncbi:hypothetical protein ACHAXS_008489 [Conticribra weissflogii]